MAKTAPIPVTIHIRLQVGNSDPVMVGSLEVPTPLKAGRALARLLVVAAWQVWWDAGRRARAEKRGTGK